MQNDMMGALTATQKETVRIAAEQPDDQEAARIAGRSTSEFRGIVEDACIAAGITAESFDERRRRICAAFVQSNMRTGEVRETESSVTQPEVLADVSVDEPIPEAESTEPSPSTIESPTEENQTMASAPTAESVRKKFTKLPEYLTPVAKLMAVGKGSKEIASALGKKQSTAINYMGVVSSTLGIQRMSAEEKAVLLKAAGVSTAKSDAPAAPAKAAPSAAPAGRAASHVSVSKYREYDRVRGDASVSDADDIEQLRAFAQLLGGGKMADVIERVVAKVGRAEQIIERAKAFASLADEEE